MEVPDFVVTNDSSRTELLEFVGSLTETMFLHRVSDHWTVASCLCHLAFWDQRTLHLLTRWSERRKIESAPLNAETIDSINAGLNAIALEVPGPLAGQLALQSATSVDACVAGLAPEFCDQLRQSGFPRYLHRHLHRCEHLRQMKESLAGHPRRQG